MRSGSDFTGDRNTSDNETEEDMGSVKSEKKGSKNSVSGERPAWLREGARRWARRSFRSRFEERMEMQARIELALLGVVLSSEAGNRPSDGLGDQRPSGTSDPVSETQDHPHD